MEGEVTNKGALGSEAYWLDACEDIPCDIDFPDFESNIVSESTDCASNPDSVDFFGGIDRILDSIKNGTGLNPVVDEGTNGVPDSTVSQTWFQTQINTVGASSLQLHHPFGASDVSSNENHGTKRRLDDGFQFYEADNGRMSLDGKAESKLVHSPKGNGVKKHENRPNDASRERGSDDQERYGKRARHGDSKNDRQYLTRGQYQSRERTSCRKRNRNWEEFDRRDGDQTRRKEHYGSSRRESRDREWRDRESKGYWERDRSGSKDMVFHLGSWEADRNREGKMTTEKNQECNGSVVEKRLEEPKEKLPEEQARQYQLDVLEQAKIRNTIAFLETGAGKTLIAVLLIRSVFSDLQAQSKKLLAVFLVPKVPLVYQVI